MTEAAGREILLSFISRITWINKPMKETKLNTLISNKKSKLWYRNYQLLTANDYRKLHRHQNSNNIVPLKNCSKKKLLSIGT